MNDSNVMTLANDPDSPIASNRRPGWNIARRCGNSETGDIYFVSDSLCASSSVTNEANSGTLFTIVFLLQEYGVLEHAAALLLERRRFYDINVASKQILEF